MHHNIWLDKSYCSIFASYFHHMSLIIAMYYIISDQMIFCTLQVVHSQSSLQKIFVAKKNGNKINFPIQHEQARLPCT